MHYSLLLSTLQESILNGRLEACGYVEGFTAELAASGSFCPPHITLPVVAAFYSLHENHGGTSPYLVSDVCVLCFDASSAGFSRVFCFVLFFTKSLFCYNFREYMSGVLNHVYSR